MRKFIFVFLKNFFLKAGNFIILFFIIYLIYIKIKKSWGQDGIS